MKYIKRIILLAFVVFIMLIFQYCYYTWPCPYAAYFGTDYPEKFSHYKFSKIKVGMLENEVLQLLGEPVNRVTKEQLLNPPLDFEYGFFYEYPIEWEYYSIKHVYIKNKKVVDIASGCTCECEDWYPIEKRLIDFYSLK